MAKQDDGLFLLEVLVDKIVFVKSPCFSDKDFRTCVNVCLSECLSVEPLEICDDEPGACVAKSNGPYIKLFNNGKSCLFSLKGNDIATAMSKFLIDVSVYKSLPCGCLPTKIIMGECTINMTKEFVEARKNFLADPTCVSYQALKDSFRIVGPDGDESGEIIMFLRISCFGNMIITRFQGPGGPPNLGTGKSPMILDRSCNPRKDFQSKQDPCACGAARVLGGGAGMSGVQPCNLCGGSGVCPPARDPYNSMPCQDSDDPCYCSGPKQAPKQQMACRNTDQYCLHVPKDCCPTGNKVVFQLPSDTCEQGHKQRAHFKFNSDGVGDLAREEPGQFKPITAEDYPGVVYDFPKQVIKMRIGKTIEMPGRKSKLEYQFITPVFTQDKVVPVKDTRTAQCVDISPGTLPGLPYYQELTNEQKINIKTWRSLKTHISKTSSYLSRNSDVNGLNIINRHYQLPLNQYADKYISSDTISNTSLRAEQCKQRSSSLYNREESVGESYISCERLAKRNAQMYATGIYGLKVSSVYMALSDNFNWRRSSYTQATASINKCFQVCTKLPIRPPSSLATSSDFYSTYTLSTSSYTQDESNTKHTRSPENVRYPRVYFFGRKKDQKNPKGMGPRDLKTRLQKTGQSICTDTRCDGKPCIRNTLKTNVQDSDSTKTISEAKTTLPPKPSKTAETSAGTSKTVSIKDDRSEKTCPKTTGITKGDMAVTVLHIRIGPKEILPCPIHGNEPCQGPKCILASSEAEQGPVKVTSINNPRRGVFEVVVRRLTGAPLAKNELMLEWTPPPSRPPPCGVPCPTTCFPPGPYRPSKCKLITCRPSPCRPKVSKKKSYGRSPCGPMPCKRCGTISCWGKSCKPCSPPRYTPCSRCISKCGMPCSPPPCGRPPCNSCKSFPCLRPCQMGHRQPRKSRSQPRIKSHKKKKSPCGNSSKGCPIVRSRSVVAPCVACCNIPLFCLPRKCCSVLPCKPPICANSCSSFCS